MLIFRRAGAATASLRSLLEIGGSTSSSLSPLGHSCRVLSRSVHSTQKLQFSGSILDEEDDMDDDGLSGSGKKKTKIYNAAEANKKYAVDAFGAPYPSEYVITPEMVKRARQEAVKKPVRVLDALGRAYAIGRRKTAIARVWVREGSGLITVNSRPFSQYFDSIQRRAVLSPLEETQTAGLYDIQCVVTGGGISGQAGAIRLGIARALETFNAELRKPLKAAGYLKRDARVVERKKPGRKKARKQFQWVKR